MMKQKHQKPTKVKHKKKWQDLIGKCKSCQSSVTAISYDRVHTVLCGTFGGDFNLAVLADLVDYQIKITANIVQVLINSNDEQAYPPN